MEELDKKITDVCENLLNLSEKIEDIGLRAAIETEVRKLLAISVEVGELESKINNHE